MVYQTINKNHKIIGNRADKMDYFLTKPPFELNPISGLPSSIIPRYPPGRGPANFGIFSPIDLKKKFFQDNLFLNKRLEEFNETYHKFTSGMLKATYPANPPGHPISSREDSTKLLKNEIDHLKKENLELKKQLKNSKPNL